MVLKSWVAEWTQKTRFTGTLRFEVDVNTLIDAFVLQIEAGQPLSLVTFKQVWKEHHFSFIHQAIPTSLGSTSFVQLLFSAALHRINHPSPFLIQDTTLNHSPPPTSAEVQTPTTDPTTAGQPHDDALATAGLPHVDATCNESGEAGCDHDASVPDMWDGIDMDGIDMMAQFDEMIANWGQHPDSALPEDALAHHSSVLPPQPHLEVGHQQQQHVCGLNAGPTGATSVLSSGDGGVLAGGSSEVVSQQQPAAYQELHTCFPHLMPLHVSDGEDDYDMQEGPAESGSVAMQLTPRTNVLEAPAQQQQQQPSHTHSLSTEETQGTSGVSHSLRLFALPANTSHPEARGQHAASGSQLCEPGTAAEAAAVAAAAILGTSDSPVHTTDVSAHAGLQTVLARDHAQQHLHHHSAPGASARPAAAAAAAAAAPPSLHGSVPTHTPHMQASTPAPNHPCLASLPPLVTLPVWDIVVRDPEPCSAPAELHNALALAPNPLFPLAGQVGALYCLYCLYETQPHAPRIPIYLPLALADVLIDLIPLLEGEGLWDALKAIQSLWCGGAFMLGALLRPIHPSLPQHHPETNPQPATAAAATAAAAAVKAAGATATAAGATAAAATAAGPAYASPLFAAHTANVPLQPIHQPIPTPPSPHTATSDATLAKPADTAAEDLHGVLSLVTTHPNSELCPNQSLASRQRLGRGLGLDLVFQPTVDPPAAFVRGVMNTELMTNPVLREALLHLRSDLRDVGDRLGLEDLGKAYAEARERGMMGKRRKSSLAPPAPFCTIFDTAFTANLGQDLASRTLEIIRNLRSQLTTKELKPSSRYNKRLAANANAGSPNSKKRNAMNAAEDDGEDEEVDPFEGGQSFTRRATSRAGAEGTGTKKGVKARKTVSFVSAAPHSLGSGIVGDIMRRRQKLQQEQLAGGREKDGGKIGKQQPHTKAGGKNGKADSGTTHLRHRQELLQAGLLQPALDTAALEIRPGTKVWLALQRQRERQSAMEIAADEMLEQHRLLMQEEGEAGSGDADDDDTMPCMDGYRLRRLAEANAETKAAGAAGGAAPSAAAGAAAAAAANVAAGAAPSAAASAAADADAGAAPSAAAGALPIAATGVSASAVAGTAAGAAANAAGAAPSAAPTALCKDEPTGIHLKRRDISLRVDTLEGEAVRSEISISQTSPACISDTAQPIPSEFDAPHPVDGAAQRHHHVQGHDHDQGNDQSEGHDQGHDHDHDLAAALDAEMTDAFGGSDAEATGHAIAPHKSTDGAAAPGEIPVSAQEGKNRVGIGLGKRVRLAGVAAKGVVKTPKRKSASATDSEAAAFRQVDGTSEKPVARKLTKPAGSRKEKQVPASVGGAGTLQENADDDGDDDASVHGDKIVSPAHLTALLKHSYSTVHLTANSLPGVFDTSTNKVTCGCTGCSMQEGDPDQPQTATAVGNIREPVLFFPGNWVKHSLLRGAGNRSWLTSVLVTSADAHTHSQTVSPGKPRKPKPKSKMTLPVQDPCDPPTDESPSPPALPTPTVSTHETQPFPSMQAWLTRNNLSLFAHKKAPRGTHTTAVKLNHVQCVHDSEGSIQASHPAAGPACTAAVAAAVDAAVAVDAAAAVDAAVAIDAAAVDAAVETIPDDFDGGGAGDHGDDDDDEDDDALCAATAAAVAALASL